MIIYIHGFSSSGEGHKAKQFREYFKEDGFIAPSLSYIPDLAIKTLDELIESYKGDVKLVGSSLGGFYALYFAKKYNVPIVLINPSIYPYITLKKVLGNAPSYHDTSTFTWLASHIEMLKIYEVDLLEKNKVMLMLQKADASLDYKEAIKKLPHAELILEDNGSHSFDAIERHFLRIKEFFRVS
ncbi:MAG: YqiA/YcfP family alpha/beta fold hydrolase [Sulfurimonas sp.]|nr:YqiA/YcfP family alpha/beta fold hydrolase [Sulfurimonas sp.]